MLGGAFAVVTDVADVAVGALVVGVSDVFVELGGYRPLAYVTKRFWTAGSSEVGFLLGDRPLGR
ncbi:hypothetical protein MF672_030750 [Actinomadura sp. ATCC 31491]|uniref:Uncharacterized protein n=1 Tax=Actinomadura luzonensis TaxID=2805427 RepID=A0ABT0G0L3_9ACTN|nr:hypothetical protein [Actinomadura luzonensis]MCK2218136.1 hypothetical protein [Actinomadura luzonensis]